MKGACTTDLTRMYTYDLLGVVVVLRLTLGCEHDTRRHIHCSVNVVNVDPTFNDNLMFIIDTRALNLPGVVQFS